MYVLCDIVKDRSRRLLFAALFFFFFFIKKTIMEKKKILIFFCFYDPYKVSTVDKFIVHSLTFSVLLDGK